LRDGTIAWKRIRVLQWPRLQRAAPSVAACGHVTMQPRERLHVPPPQTGGNHSQHLGDSPIKTASSGRVSVRKQFNKPAAMPLPGVVSVRSASFFGTRLAPRPVAVSCVPRVEAVTVEAKRICDVTGKKRNKANKVCFSNKKSRTFQEVNLQVIHLLQVACALRLCAPRAEPLSCVLRGCHAQTPLRSPILHASYPHTEKTTLLGEGAAMGFNQALGEGSAHHQEEGPGFCC
jgi:hypothetical protein